MDSLLATYASSDDEEEQRPEPPQPQPSLKPSFSLFSSLPKPQSSSSPSSTIFSSIPPPDASSQVQKQPKREDSSTPPPKSSAFFSSLPPPKSETRTDFPIPPPNPKRVVQFRPPVPQPPSSFDDDDKDEEDEEEKERKIQRQIGQDTSVKSFLSSMPTPKNSGHASLGAVSTALGSGRRSIVETDGPMSVPLSSDDNGVNNEVGFGSNDGNIQENLVGASDFNNDDQVGVARDQGYASYGGYDAYGSTCDYGSYEGYGHYDSSNWYNAPSGNMAYTMSGGVESFASLGGKRRRDQAPTEIVEVKQDELMKNRPTEDKSKLTGIAFGPSYQPASTKGKPSKLHKQKHQIGALYHDMKQNEMALQERRARGFLTKAETQAKYGW